MRSAAFFTSDVAEAVDNVLIAAGEHQSESAFIRAVIRELESGLRKERKDDE